MLHDPSWVASVAQRQKHEPKACGMTIVFTSKPLKVQQLILLHWDSCLLSHDTNNVTVTLGHSEGDTLWLAEVGQEPLHVYLSLNLIGILIGYSLP